MGSLEDNNGILEMPNDPKFEPDPIGYGAHIFYKMKEFKNEIAQIDVATNKSDTYQAILTKSVRVALHMKAMGIQETDIVSLCTGTHSETCLPFWAAFFSGIKLANLDPTLSSSDTKCLLKVVEPKLIFCNPESVKNLETVIKDLNLKATLVVFGETEQHIPFKEFLKPHNEEQDFKPKVAKNLFDTIIILFSSGTTGLPKGICITHYGMLSVMNICKDMFYLKTILFYASPQWISYIFIMSSTVISGGKRILAKSFNANNVLELIQKYKVTYLFLTPALIPAVTSQQGINSETYDTTSLRSIMIGGERIISDQILKIRKLLPNTYINQCYGFTEISLLFSGFYSKTDLEMLGTKITSCGRMVPGTMCKVVDVETNKIVGKNQRGELLVKTKRLMNGYYNDPKRTAEAFDEDGFFHTGDVVYYDDDYYFYLVDRIKHMFKYKSWHIVPTELESILLNNPAVKEALVIGYPNEQDLNHPMAVIVLKDGANVTENEVLRYFNDQVTHWKKLKGGIKFVKNLPKTNTGKYNRPKLLSLIINNEI